MYTLVKSSTYPQLFSEQLPAIVLSLAIAEFWYKFGSFTLECIAFLATWFVIDFLIGRLRQFFLPTKTE